MSPKVLLVGFDGATFDIIRPMIADGRGQHSGSRLPTLAHILQSGAHGTLRSNIPPVTPSAWTSVFTGKNPGKHGIYDFEEIDPATYQFKTVQTDKHHEKTIWQLLGEANKRSIVMDVPFTYPPRPLNGLMLTGYGTPRTPGTVFTYPDDLAAHLPPELHPHIRVALPRYKFDRSQQFIDEWQEVMAGRRELLKHLISQQEWEFFMVVFSITDNMAHVFWTYVDPAHPNYYREEAENYRNAFLHGYEMCDQLLGELMEKAGPETTTLVLSDHGFGSVRPRQYILQRLLEGGYVTLKGASHNLSVRSRVLRTAVTTYNRFPFLREWVKGMRPDNLNTFKRTLRQAGITPSSPNNFDHEKTYVIPSSFGLRLWVNEAGRFSQGIVTAAEKEPFLAELSHFLLADRDKITGKPIIAHTYQGKDLYHGPFANLGPDLVIEYANFYRPDAGTQTRNPHVEGGHTLDGIFLAHGPAIAQTEVQDASLIDLAPTILHILGQPIPPDMDGRVLSTIFDASYLAQHPIQPGNQPAHFATSTSSSEYTEAEEAEIIEQFRQLGYVD
jgi:predicted AlkP superfamily phosphohydrolase/phosphomutase